MREWFSKNRDVLRSKSAWPLIPGTLLIALIMAGILASFALTRPAPVGQMITLRPNQTEKVVAIRGDVVTFPVTVVKKDERVTTAIITGPSGTETVVIPETIARRLTFTQTATISNTDTVTQTNTVTQTDTVTRTQTDTVTQTETVTGPAVTETVVITETVTVIP